MTYKKPLLIGIAVLAVLALLYAAAWRHDHPRWLSAPASSATAPKVDRSRIPLGPYTVDLRGLVAGWSKDSVTLYVVLQPKSVHFQLTGEVGSRLNDAAAVETMTVSFSPIDTPNHIVKPDETSDLFDGLRPSDGFGIKHQAFDIPNTRDALENPIRVMCFLDQRAFAELISKRSFKEIRHGSCRAYFRVRKSLFAIFTHIPPKKLSEMSLFLPQIYLDTSNLIQGVQ
jgi:hypothetical protein